VTRTTALVPFQPAAIDHVVVWTTLPTDERRRRVVRACTAETRDTATLWSVTEAHLRAFGRMRESVSPRTLSVYRRVMEHLITHWQSTNLLHPDRDDAARWLSSLEKAGFKPGSVTVYLAAARAFYAALRWSGATASEPFKDIHAARDMIPRWEKRQPYSEDDLKRMEECAVASDRVLVYLCSHAGLRVSEALGLNWKDIQFSQGDLVVHKGKGGAQRTIPLTPSLRSVLQTWKGDPAALATTVLPYQDRTWAWRRLKAVAEDAGIPYKGVHALRHSAGTRLYKQTGSLDIAARFLGHRQLETTRIYSKWSDEGLRKALDW